MNKWFTSDIHFGHKNVIESCNRPYSSVEEMNEDIIKKWNDQVKPEDHVYFLGDFSFLNATKTRAILSRLNGTIHGTEGNHDKGKNLVAWGFSSMYQEVDLRLSKRITVKMSHYPYGGDRSEEDRYPHLRPRRKKGQWLLHGHIHNMWKIKGNMINVGWDAWGRLVSSDELIDIIEKGSVMDKDLLSLDNWCYRNQGCNIVTFREAAHRSHESVTEFIKHAEKIEREYEKLKLKIPCKTSE